MRDQKQTQKFSKKLIFAFGIGIAIFTIVVVMLASCGKNNKMYEYKGSIAPYLHEINYTDYREDTEHHSASSDEVSGCSSVRNGNFVGRNLDLVYDYCPEFIVRVEANENHYASLAVACHSGLREDILLNGKYDKELELVPNHTYDGINENGVYCNVNVVSAEDTGELTGTNPQAKDSVYLPFLVRYVLDHSTSADHAVQLIKDANIYGKIMTFNSHYMICDKDKTYIVEFIDNKPVVKEKTGNQQVMTNYYHNMDKINEHAMGVERYQTLQANYASGDSMDGMFKLMQMVQYSKMYTSDSLVNVASEFFEQSVINANKNSDLSEITKIYNDLKSDYSAIIKNGNRDAAIEKGY